MLNGLMLILLMLLFIGIFLWAWSPKNREKFDEAARLPLRDDNETTDSSNSKKDANDE